MKYFWEERFYKGKFKCRLLISANHRAIVQALETIEACPKNRLIKKGEVFSTLIRLMHKPKGGETAQ